MEVVRARFIRDILEEHLEELEMLWERRQNSMRSPVLTLRELLELEERIEAHVQGLLVAGDGLADLAGPGLLEPKEAGKAFASAYALLRSQNGSSAGKVLQVFLGAKDGQFEGIRQALCHGPIDAIRSELEKASLGAPSPVAAAAMESLVIHGYPIAPGLLDGLIHDGNSIVRSTGWRIVALGNGPPGCPGRESVLEENEPCVRREALLAAAWTRKQWLLEFCAVATREPKPGRWYEILLLAILGKPEHLPLILGVAGASALGARRFQVLGAFGHPGVMEHLFVGIRNPDPAQAAAAAHAFSKITGCEIASVESVPVMPREGQKPDEFEKEFLEEVILPDPDLAEANWRRLKPEFERGTRWCRGFDFSGAPSPEALRQVDLESRWEACLRGSYGGTWQGKAMDLEALTGSLS